jgi:CRISPR system Cascade subunit CasA
MLNQFNLIDEPWLPMVGTDIVSLLEVFTKSCRELGGNPIQKIAVTKLLQAIAQSAYTPKNVEDWLAIGPEGLAEKCLNYLRLWYDSFYLYGDKPFLQLPAIKAAEIKPFGAVLPEVATGNTTILTETQIEKQLTNAEKALLIVCQMCFSLGGKKTDNSVVLSPGYYKKRNLKNKPTTGKTGPSMGYKGMMHSYLMGETLIETIWFNLFTEEDINAIGLYSEGVGTPPWESMPTGEDCIISRGLQKSLIGRLIPLSRFCLLTEDGLHYSEGIDHPSYQDGVIDPSVAVDFSRKKTQVIWIDPEKRPWRYLTALLSFINQNSTGHFDCMQLRYCLPRVRSHSIQFGLWSGGLKVSSNAGEQFISGEDDYVESVIILESASLGETWFETLQVEMRALDTLSTTLRRSISAYYQSQNMKADKHADAGVNLYWQLCEHYFQTMVNYCVDESARHNLRHHFANCVHKVYDMKCQNITARQLDAWANYRPKLGSYLIQ